MSAESGLSCLKEKLIDLKNISQKSAKDRCSLGQFAKNAHFKEIEK